MGKERKLLAISSTYGLIGLLLLSSSGLFSPANAAPTPKPKPVQPTLTDSGLLRNDPNRPVALIAAGLKVTAAEFVLCFDKVSPAVKNSHPETVKVLTNKAFLLPCLQKYNPRITDSSLNAVMDKYRPGGHEAQTPQK